MRLCQSALCSVTGDIRALKELARITCAVLGEARNGTRALALSADVPTAELSAVGRTAALGRPQEEMQHLGHPQRGSDKLFSFPLSEPRETPAPSPPSTHLMKCHGCVSPGPPRLQASLGERQSVLCANYGLSSGTNTSYDKRDN